MQADPLGYLSVYHTIRSKILNREEYSIIRNASVQVIQKLRRCKTAFSSHLVS